VAKRHVSGVGTLVVDPYWRSDVVCHADRRDPQHRVPKVEAASSSLVPRSNCSSAVVGYLIPKAHQLAP